MWITLKAWMIWLMLIIFALCWYDESVILVNVQGPEPYYSCWVNLMLSVRWKSWNGDMINMLQRDNLNWCFSGEVFFWWSQSWFFILNSEFSPPRPPRICVYLLLADSTFISTIISITWKWTPIVENMFPNWVCRLWGPSQKQNIKQIWELLVLFSFQLYYNYTIILKCN